MIKTSYYYFLAGFFALWGGGFLFGGIFAQHGLFIAIGVFGACLFLWFLFLSIKVTVENILIKTKGKKVVASFVSTVGAGMINDVSYYKIIFAWTNDQNKKITTKSAKLFTRDEVELFREAQLFEVVTYKNIARVNEVPSMGWIRQLKSINKDDLKSLDIEQIKEEKRRENLTRCPNCGAQHKDEKFCEYCGFKFKK